MSIHIVKENDQHGCNMHFDRFTQEFQNIERGLELIDVISYRGLRRLISSPDRPNMDCYRVGCHSPTFAMKACMNLYNSLCVVMSNCIGKENGQHECNMHFCRIADEVKKTERGLQ